MIAKMKLVLCILASFCLLAQADQSSTTDAVHLARQKSIYELFWHVDQPTVFFPDLLQQARTFNIADNVAQYGDQEAVTEFLDLLKHGMLPRGQVFTMTNPEMRHQAVILFRVLQSAKTFDTLYNTAIWARFNVNELMYVYSLSVAVMHHPETRNIKLPPLYEVVPNFFFNDDVMQRAQNIAMGDVPSATRTVGTVNHFVLPANYSGWYWTRESTTEERINYFTEDIGLNTFYFLVNHDFPRFMPSTKYNLPSQFRGEYYFFIHKQMLSRYNLERLSNDMGPIEYVSVDKPIVNGYYPTMHHRNGLPFPQRETNAIIPLHMHNYVQMLKDLHQRISTAIDIGYVVDKAGHHINIYTENGLNILGNIIEGNADSINIQLYGQLDLVLRRLLGFGFQSNVQYQVVPGALEYMSTSLRDPVFYSMYKDILTYYHRYKKNLPLYKTEELLFPGVTVTSVTVDRLVTYFDYFETMLNNGLSIQTHNQAANTLILARQQRLNHKPFTYHIVVNSDKNTRAMIRIFLGPKRDVYGHELRLVDNYKNFLQVDEFLADLKAGTNNVDRGSHESTFVIPDEVPSHAFYKNIVANIKGTETHIQTVSKYGFPDRLILPKGRKEGIEYQLFVIVSPINTDKFTHVRFASLGDLPVDGRPMGFPLDRPVHPRHFMVPNMALTDVVIYHSEMDELNVTA